MRGHKRDHHEGPQAHARDRGGARRGRAAGRRRDRLNTEEIFDRAAPTYDVAPFPFFTPFGEALVEFAGIRAGERVLDAGCGAGAALAPAARAGASVVGVELSAQMAERARTLAPQAEVRVGDASRLDFGDDSFDVVTSAFVIFFIPDPTAALREWRRVLAPGGRMAIATWGGPDPRWAFEREIRRRYIGELDPELLQDLGRGLALLERFTTPEKVEAELRDGGFDDIEIAEHRIEFVFGDERDWWEWNLAHANRRFLDGMPPAAFERMKTEVEEAMQHVRDERGFPRAYTALFARCRESNR